MGREAPVHGPYMEPGQARAKAHLLVVGRGRR